MNIWGKTAAWLAAAGILLAVYFTSKTLAVRSAWMERAQKNEAEIRKNDEEIAKKTATLDEKRKELFRTMLGWDRYWNEVQAGINAQTGVLSLKNIGTKADIQQGQVLYVFGLNPEGTSQYVGDFKVARAGANATEAAPSSRRRANDPQPAQFLARVRTMIPNQFQARLGTLDQQLLAAEQLIDTSKEDLARQGQLFEQTGGLIEARMAEINGNAKLEGEPIPEVHIKGLLTAIADEEEARNAALIESDRLMRKLRQTRLAFEATRRENERMTKSLPQPAASEQAVGAAGR